MPALSTTLRQLSPPSFASALPTLRWRSSCTTPALSPALHRRPHPRCSRALRSTALALSPWYTSARLSTAPALSLAARRCFTFVYAWALCSCWRYSLRFAALPRPSPALFPMLCGHLGTPRVLKRARACSSLILLLAGPLVGQPQAGAGYDARCHNQTVIWCSWRRHMKFPVLHLALETSGIGSKIGI